MKLLNTKFKKTIVIVTATIVVVVALCIVFISPITKYLVEKYDVQYTGREITMDWAYVNPFTGYVYLRNVKIYEFNKDTLFFSASGAVLDFSMHKLLYRTCEITELNFDEPRGTVIQRKNKFNFDDIVERFRPGKSDAKKKGFHFSILHITTNDGEFHYQDKIIPINYFIKKVNLESSGFRYDTDTIATAISFLPGSGTGKVKGDFTINTKTLDYHMSTVMTNLDLELLRQYLWELINYGMFSARIDLNVKARGNFHHTDSIILRGRLAINDFHLGKTVTDDYASFRKLVMVVKELSPRNNKYLFDSLTLDSPFVSYERFDSLDNVEAMFGKKGSNISDVTQQEGRFNLVIQLSRYIKKLSRKFFESQYNINALAVNNGDIKFSDYALNERFSIQAKHVSLKADSISKTNTHANFYLQSALYPYGNLSAKLRLNPRDSGDIDFQYHILNVSATVFNPYVITYTSFPLDKGTLELKGSWKVREGIIKSDNNILLIEPHVTSRLKNEDTKWLPLPLIMSFVRERGNIINYKIPITGNLKDPRFHLGDIIIDLLENIFIKPSTIPYGLEVKSTEKEIEKSLSLTWPMHRSAFAHRQEKFVKKMAEFLEENKEASIEITPQSYLVKEKEYILYFETKKKYFLMTHHKKLEDFNEEDSVQVEKMSVKDLGHVLVNRLQKQTRDTTMFTIQDKCNYFLGDNRVDKKYRRLEVERENTFRSFFIKNGTNNRLKISPIKHIIPYNGFSCYHIKYEGEIPKELLDSYEEIQDLNKAIFRRKYFKKDK